MCKRWLSLGTGVFFLAILASSCTNTKHLTYMQGKFDTARLSQINLKEPVIRKGDLLSIIVYSDNPAATTLFNQAQSGGSGNPGATISSSGGGSSSGSSGGSTSGSGGSSSSGSGSGTQGSGGYLVDEKGNIEMQQLGVLHVDGMARSTLKDTLELILKQYLKNPYCTIRFLNYRFTMIGEVMRPGVYNFPGDHINLMEALGLGGDLTFFGRRDNVLVIRQSDGKREYGRLDLTKPEIMGSPFFDLQPNDIVYVEASRKKIAASDQTLVRNISIATSIISTLAIIVAIFKH